MIRLASQNAWRIAGIFLRSMVAGAFLIAAAQASAASNGKRVALVIGNSAYQNAQEHSPIPPMMPERSPPRSRN